MSTSTKDIVFHLIENYEEDLDSIYEDFKQDYLNKKIKTVEIKQKYGLTQRPYRKLINRVKEETGFKRNDGCGNKSKPVTNTHKLPMFIYFSPRVYGHDKYYIQKNVNGVVEYFGLYPSLKLAVQDVERLKQVNWDKNLLPVIRGELLK